MMHAINENKTKYRGRHAGRTVCFVILVIMAASFLMPIILTVTNSFMQESEINANYGVVFDALASGSDSDQNAQTGQSSSGGRSGYTSEKVNLKLIPDMVTFKQYSTILLQSPDYLLKFWNSVILTVPIVVGQLLLALLASYFFTRYRNRHSEHLFFVYMMLMLMPYQVSLVPNFLVCRWLGIINTRMAVILPGICSTFSVYMLTKFMRRIPASLTEAAELDGATEWEIFRLIYVPLSRSAITSTAILVFIDYWNMVEQPLILMEDTDMHPLSVFLSKINQGEIGLAFAAAVIYMVPTILVFLYGQEELVEGISYAGGVKG